MKNTLQLSVIIVTHNAEIFLQNTLHSLSTQTGLTKEVIVVDNASTDGTKHMVEQEFADVIWVERPTSVGFSAANNLGLSHAHADTILFLNPDVTFTKESDLSKLYDKLWSDDKIGGLTPKVVLALNNKIDETCHRGFPTPWAALTHFSGLSRIFPNSAWANEYSKNYLGYEHEHTVDAIGGMFMLIRRSAGDQVGWWDEDYSFYGEDLDFCYRLVVSGYHNLFYPSVTVVHYKGATTGMSKQSKHVSTATEAKTKQVKLWSIEAMQIFYAKHYAKKYPFFINWLVSLGISLLKFIRLSL